MEKTVLILLVAIGGTMAQIFGSCNLETCRPELPYVPDGVFDAEELKRFCPPFLESIKCAKTTVTSCTGSEPSELTTSEDEAIASSALVFVGVSDVIIDLCDEGSALNRAYTNGVECFNEKFEDIAKECAAHGRKVFKEFKEPVLELLDGDEDVAKDIKNEEECLVAGYTIACATTKLRFDCSSETAETFSQIMKRSNLIKATACSPKDLQTLQTEFVDYLETQGGNRDVLSAAFDFRKKK